MAAPSDDKSRALVSQLVRTNENFHPELDFLRSSAVILVVIDHTCLALQHKTLLGIPVGRLGLVGVWMFFVHTALVLLWSLERKPYTVDFYIRRAFRIYPLVWAALVVACVTRAPVVGVDQGYFAYRHITFSNLAANFLLLINLGTKEHGWFAILHVLWTLPAEVEMYLVLPVVFAFVRQKPALWVILVFWALACATAHVQGAIFPLFSATVPDFLGGVVAYLLYAQVKPRIPGWMFPVTLFLLIVWGAHVERAEAAWFLTLVLGLVLPFHKPFRTSLYTRVCHHVAKYSYGIYLVHPFALVVGVYLLRGHVGVAVQLAVAMVVLVVVSLIAYHGLEKPMIGYGARLAARVEVRRLGRRSGERALAQVLPEWAEGLRG